MTVLQTHEGKRLLYMAPKVCAVLCEPEMQYLYPKSSELDPSEKVSSVSS